MAERLSSFGRWIRLALSRQGVSLRHASMARKQRNHKTAGPRSGEPTLQGGKPTPARALGVLVLFLLLAGVVVLFLTRPASPPPARSQVQDRLLQPEQTTAQPAPKVELVNSVAELPGAPPMAEDDPSADGWDTELFHNRAKLQLELLAELMTLAEQKETKPLAGLLATDFGCEALVPEQLQLAFEDQVLRVERGVFPADTDRTLELAPVQASALPLQGSNGFQQAVEQWHSAIQGAHDLHMKFKVFRVLPLDGEVVTHALVEVEGHTPTGMVEQHSTWIMSWDQSEKPLLRSIQVNSFEQVTSRHEGGTLFADCSESVLGANESYRRQLLQGYQDWLQQTQVSGTRMNTFGNPGIAIGDVNGDGLDDLFLCQEWQLPSRLFLQNPDGTATEVSKDWGVDWVDGTRSALLVDLDNDGDQDLVVSVRGGVVIAENDQQQRFKLRELLSTSDDTYTLAAADYDNDGHLDLFVCVYEPTVTDSDERNITVPIASGDRVYHDANDGGPNALFRGLGNWQFEEVTDAVGLGENNHKPTFAASWEDYDNDGDQDLYVANDYGRDNLFRNDDGQFVEVSEEAQIEDSAFGMSIAWGDENRDGWMDAYVANMYSSAGNRIAFQPNFKADAPEEVKNRIQRTARGNTLLRNQGKGNFRDVSGTAGVEMGRWSWSSNFIDFNNDGWEDLVVANGFLTNELSDDL